MKAKPKPKLIKLPTVPTWRYECTDGAVSVYLPNGKKLTAERINILLDFAKQELMSETDG